MKSQKTKSTVATKRTPFEDKLLSRLTNAADRMSRAKSSKDVQPRLTIRRVSTTLTPRAIADKDVKAARKRFNVSQAVFAAFIQVPVRTLQEWEQGRSEIHGCASRLIAEMIDNPEYWKSRLRKIVLAE